jgi:hypothetical protein
MMKSALGPSGLAAYWDAVQSTLFELDKQARGHSSYFKIEIFGPELLEVAMKASPYEHHHKDGSLWAKGQTINGVATGYWEWFRKDGTKLRSGYFENGEQIGEWTTYDAKGAVYKVTTKRPKK